MRFSLSVNDRHPYLKKTVSSFIDRMEKKGHKYSKEDPEIIFVIGGDGTLLKSIRENVGKNVSFLLINDGNLGFYKEFEISEIDTLVDYFDEKSLTYEPHRFLSIEDEYGHKALACNEFMLASSIKTLHFIVYMNGNYFMEVRGSGICLASPFGSSGYNHSLGGALLAYDNGMAMSLLAPIRNHTFHPLVSSLVTSDEDVLGIEVLSESEYELASDMKVLTNFEGKRYTIKKSDETFTLAHLKDFDPYQRIRKSFLE